MVGVTASVVSADEQPIAVIVDNHGRLVHGRVPDLEHAVSEDAWYERPLVALTLCHRYQQAGSVVARRGGHADNAISHARWSGRHEQPAPC
jgi:hypothetical protein